MQIVQSLYVFDYFIQFVWPTTKNVSIALIFTLVCGCWRPSCSPLSNMAMVDYIFDINVFLRIKKALLKLAYNYTDN